MTMLLVSVLLPLLLALMMVVPGPFRSAAIRMAPWAALPTVVAAVGAADPLAVELEWLLLGARLGIDTLGRIFLLFTGFVWFASGLFTRAYPAAAEKQTRYYFFYLTTLAGNVGLIVSHDIASFLFFFTLMTFAAYGLIVHEGSGEAIRAGRVYIGLAVVGESLMLAGGLLAAVGAPSLLMADIAASLATSPERGLAILLLFAGLGVKGGLIPLHVWLPLAHPVAPTAASAVLSACMIKAGLLGWLRLLPLGDVGLPAWGAGVIIVGVASSFYAAIVGVLQSDPKTVLAYSSVSQMGIMTAAVGAGLLGPGAAPVAIGAAAGYAFHHALAKGVLFLGVGVASRGARTRWQRRTVIAGLVFAALSLAGAPLTSGSIAKYFIHELALRTPGGWGGFLDLMLPLTAVGTTLLMARFLQRVAIETAPKGGERGPEVALVLPWVGLIALSAVAVRIVPVRLGADLEPPHLPDAAGFWAGSWPILMGVAIFAAIVALSRARGAHLQIPAGDLLIVAERGFGTVRRRVGRRIGPPAIPDPWSWFAGHWYSVYADRRRWAGLSRAEGSLTRWGSAGLLLLVSALVFLALLQLGAG